MSLEKQTFLEIRISEETNQHIGGRRIPEELRQRRQHFPVGLSDSLRPRTTVLEVYL
jgi:hypothetical protein